MQRKLRKTKNAKLLGILNNRVLWLTIKVFRWILTNRRVEQFTTWTNTFLILSSCLNLSVFNENMQTKDKKKNEIFLLTLSSLTTEQIPLRRRKGRKRVRKIARGRVRQGKLRNKLKKKSKDFKRLVSENKQELASIKHTHSRKIPKKLSKINLLGHLE